MRFVNLYWLLAGLAACIIVAAGFWRSAKKRRAALSLFASGPLLEKLTQSVSPAKRNTKRVLVILAVAAVCLALARPQAGFDWREVKTKGIDILLAVDTSKSMLAADVAPNRLERSKLGILDFVDKIGSDRVGLIAFSGTAFLQCPLTLDHNAFAQALSSLDTSVIPLGGTDLASAIRLSEEVFTQGAAHKFLVLVTDGEDLEGEALAAAKEAAGKGIVICTVGVGTPAGELLPVPGKNGVEFVRDQNGQMVKSRLDEDMLVNIAQAAGGIYAPLGRQAEGLEAVYRKKLALAPKKEFSDRLQQVPIDRFEWPLLLAVLLLGLEYVLSDRRKPVKPATVSTARRRLFRKAGLAKKAAIVLCLIAPATLAHASCRSAEKAYRAGDFAKAVAQYKAAAQKSPQDAAIKLNLGAALYKAGRLEEAADALEQSLSTEKLDVQTQAYYNLGNTYYRQGQKTGTTDQQATMAKWQKAVESYEAALKLAPKDADARFNHDFVKKKLQELQKQEQNQDKKNQQDKKDQKGQKNKQDQKNQQGQDSQNKQNGQDSQNGQKNQQEKSQAGNGKEGNNQNQDKNQADSGKDQQQGKEKNNKDKGSSGQAAGAGKQSQENTAPEQGRAGQMSREQAQNLLNSLKAQEVGVPVYTPATPPAQDDNRRDW